VQGRFPPSVFQNQEAVISIVISNYQYIARKIHHSSYFKVSFIKWPGVLSVAYRLTKFLSQAVCPDPLGPSIPAAVAPSLYAKARKITKRPDHLLFYISEKKSFTLPCANVE